MSKKTNFVMIGNPGVGKSTILNALVGEVKFESGLSFGSGLTTVCQKYVGNHGMVYIDTPGLSDIDMRKKAAEEITSALKSGGYFRIFFIITLEGGRTRPDDVTTMKLVLDSAPIQNDYSIIVNKLDKNLYAALSRGDNRRKLETALNKGLPGTTSIYYNLEVEELKSTDNALHQLPTTLAAFIVASPMIDIPVETVKPIKEDNFDEMRAEFGKIIERLEKNQEFLQKSLNEERENNRKLQDDNIKKYEELQREHNADMREMMNEHALELRRISRENAQKIPVAAPPLPGTPPSPVAASPAQASPTPASGPRLSEIVGLIPGFGPFGRVALQVLGL